MYAGEPVSWLPAIHCRLPQSLPGRLIPHTHNTSAIKYG